MCWPCFANAADYCFQALRLQVLPISTDIA
jgi:hypothetical protein